MASTPSYDPYALRSPASAAKLKSESGAPLVNRTVQYGYAPGSTFKVVTATAALDTGQFTPSSTVSGRNGVVVSGVPLSNDNDESFGPLTLTEALAKSVNTVWAQVAEHLGARTLARYMRRFGFDSKPQLDYPAEEMSASGEYHHERLIPPTSPFVDVGRMGIGQDKLQVTPLQMAEVAAAVANHGRLMAPHLTARILDPEGRTSAADLPPRAGGRDEALDRRHRDLDDGSCRQRRHRHPRADPRRAGGRQDRHRRNADRDRDQQRVVHRLRPRL